MRRMYSYIPLFCVIVVALIFEVATRDTAPYNGLPMVACINPTKKIVESYVVYLSVYNENQHILLPETLGHDNGNCLRVIYTNDNSGKVIIASNENKRYSLQDIFSSWHKPFDQNRVLNLQADNGHSIKIYINGKQVAYQDPLMLSSGNVVIVQYAKKISP